MFSPVKPICVIYLPRNFEMAYGRNNAPETLMKALNGNLNEMVEPPADPTAQNYWAQYYWFVFYHSSNKDVKFKVYHPKDFTIAQFAEMKTMITKAIEQSKIAAKKYEVDPL